METCKLVIAKEGDDVTVTLDGRGKDLLGAIATVLEENENVRNLVMMAVYIMVYGKLNEENNDEQRTVN